ncbi:hypothetical protein F8388_011109 [Cannabis sativa]|uniref:DUF1985 domain-containing protein n=1 Tax=Cannabis sativa TaxID=3483 RepID=A0A7J6EBZ5_CANSA|nr:hypothetical protein F8388_011109 [Cannabis sativa]
MSSLTLDVQANKKRKSAGKDVVGDCLGKEISFVDVDCCEIRTHPNNYTICVGDVDMTKFGSTPNTFSDTYFCCQNVTYELIEKRFNSTKFKDNDSAIRLAGLYLVTNYLMGNYKDKNVSVDFLNIFGSDDFETFPWGKVIYNDTLKHLQAAMKGKPKKKYFDGGITEIKITSNPSQKNNKQFKRWKCYYIDYQKKVFTSSKFKTNRIIPTEAELETMDLKELNFGYVSESDSEDDFEHLNTRGRISHFTGQSCNPPTMSTPKQDPDIGELSDRIQGVLIKQEKLEYKVDMLKSHFQTKLEKMEESINGVDKKVDSCLKYLADIKDIFLKVNVSCNKDKISSMLDTENCDDDIPSFNLFSQPLSNYEITPTNYFIEGQKNNHDGDKAHQTTMENDNAKIVDQEHNKNNQSIADDHNQYKRRNNHIDSGDDGDDEQKGGNSTYKDAIIGSGFYSSKTTKDREICKYVSNDVAISEAIEVGASALVVYDDDVVFSEKDIDMLDKKEHEAYKKYKEKINEEIEQADLNNQRTILRKRSMKPGLHLQSPFTNTVHQISFDEWFKIGLQEKNRRKIFSDDQAKLELSFDFGINTVNRKHWFYDFKTARKNLSVEAWNNICDIF